MDIYTFTGFFPNGDTIRYIHAHSLHNAIANLQQSEPFIYNTDIGNITPIDSGKFIVVLQDEGRIVTYTVIWYKRYTSLDGIS